MWLIIVTCLLGLLVYFKIWKPFNFWKERGVLHTRPIPFLGNLAPAVLRKKPFVEVVKDLYLQHYNARYNGIFQFSRPMLLIRDIDLIKQITVKDFDNFMDHNVLGIDQTDVLMEKNLVALKGQKWRDMRSTLSPAFTSSKMRSMFILISDCAIRFVKYFEDQKSTDVIKLEMKDVFTRFTNDAIASTAFGLECDSLKEKDNKFYQTGLEVTTFGGRRALKFFGFGMFPKLMKLLNVTLVPKKTREFFLHLVQDTISYREQNNVIRPDMIHLLMEARKGKLKHEDENEIAGDTGFATAKESKLTKDPKFKNQEITDMDITAQAFIFLLGGFDTSSSLMCFMAHELAVNPDVQDELRKEIDQTLKACQGKVTYEAILGMKYMDMVVSETLRKWPPGFQLDRQCTKDYIISGTRPGEHSYMVKKNDLILIPVYGIHHDEKYFSNPEKFDPERFNDENKGRIIPGSYLPFGFGPRNCIGSRFALLENKTLFFHLLSKFALVPIEETLVPMVLSTVKMNMLPNTGFWLGLKPRTTFY